MNAKPKTIPARRRRHDIESATRIRREQLDLLMEMRDHGPIRIFWMSSGENKPGERHYDITALEILPWLLDKSKGWVSISDRNLCTITPAGVRAIERWAQHQFEPVHLGFVEPGRLVTPQATAP